MINFIDLKTQYELHKIHIDDRIRRVIEHGQFIMGPEIYELENILANYVGVNHCITVGSGTHSLEIALRALGIGIGDEVITVPFSWISSAEIIPLVGARPIFVDIQEDSYNLDPIKLEKAITKKTKAIITVSLFGQISNIEEINKIAKKYKIAVIEDGAQSFGATRNGKKSCGVSLIGSTSFFPAKPLGCYGDGGALFTDDDEIANAMRAIRTHGGLVRHNHTHLGTNGRLDTIQAAIILAKIPFFQEEINLREKIGANYTDMLTKYCVTPGISYGNTHVFAQYTIKVEEKKRSQIQNNLNLLNIPTGVYYPKCFHEQPVFKYLGYKYGDFPVAEEASRRVLSLPMHPYLNEQKQNFIIDSLIKEILL